MRILITGGTTGIGKAIAARRLAAGDDVIVTASSEASRAKIEAEFAGQSRFSAIEFSLARPEESERRVADALASGIDGLVLNACSRVTRLRLFHEVPFGDVDEYLRANITGNCWLLHRVLPTMVERAFGRILLISSVSVQQGTSRYGTYCAAKSAMEGLIRNLAVDYGERNIFSNILQPGIIATERTSKFWKREHFAKRATSIIPAGQLGTPEAVAEATDAFLSPTSYINGASITVSGGLPMVRSAGVLEV